MLFIMVAAGGIISCLFDVFRLIRRVLHLESAAVTAVFDILFCIIAVYAVSACVWNFNDGLIRFYIPVGLVVGAVIYFAAVSEWFLKIFYFIFENIFKFVLLIFKILLTPLRFLYKILIAYVKGYTAKKGKKEQCIYDRRIQK